MTFLLRTVNVEIIMPTVLILACVVNHIQLSIQGITEFQQSNWPQHKILPIAWSKQISIFEIASNDKHCATCGDTS
jgi:hypothetical protein